MKADSISLKSLQPLLNQFPDLSKKIELKNGTGEATSAKIWRSDGAVAYHVKGHFNNAALSYENYILADGAAFLIFMMEKHPFLMFQQRSMDKIFLAMPELTGICRRSCFKVI